jgi:hypothetical protein
MALPGSVQAASPGLIGFDHSAGALSLAQAKTFAAKGFRFCVRYVSRTDETRAGHQQSGTPDLSAEEAQNILDAGMALMVVQHVAPPGWSPTLDLGQQYGENAAHYASVAGLLPGVNVWLDLEGIKQGTAHQDIVKYCNAWFDAVATAGYEPGVYVGFDVFLSPDELFLDLKFKHYWRAAGDIPDIAHRGYQLIQHVDDSGASEFDRDVTRTDDLNGTVLWQTTNPALVA